MDTAPRPTRSAFTAPIIVVVALGALITAIGGFVAWFHPATLLPAGSPVTHGVDLYGQRMAARDIAIGVALVVFLAMRASRALAAVMSVLILIEVGDTISAVANSNWAQASGVIIAVAYIWAATRLLRAPAVLPGRYRDPYPPSTADVGQATTR